MRRQGIYRKFAQLLMVLGILLLGMQVVAQDEVSTYTAPNGTYAFDYPADWFIVGVEGKNVFLSNFELPNQAGQVLMRMTIDNIAPIEDPMDAIDLVLTTSREPFEEFTPMTIGDHPAVYAEASDDELGRAIFSLVLLEDNIMASLSAITTDTSVTLDDFRPVFMLMIESVVYAPQMILPVSELPEVAVDASELNETYLPEEAEFTFRYPAGWVTIPQDVRGVMVSSTVPSDETPPDYTIQVLITDIPANFTEPVNFLYDAMYLMSDSLFGVGDPVIAEGNLDGRRVLYTDDERIEMGTVVVLQVDEGMLAGFLSTSETMERSSLETQIFAIASTLEIIEPELEQLTVDTSDLTNRYQFNDLFTVDYPAEWLLDESETFFELTNMASDGETVAEGQVNVIVTVFSKSSENQSDMPLVEIAQSMQAPGREVAPAEEILLNETQVVVMPMGLEGMDGIVVFIPLTDDLVGEVLAFTRADGLEAFEDTIYAIASTIQIVER